MINGDNGAVSFFTCCYRADWEFFLKEGRLKEMIERCNHSFSSTNLIINNVDDRQEVTRYAELAVQQGVIDYYFFSEDYAEKVLERFAIKRRDFRLDGYDGYWYSIAPLTAIYLCRGEYLLYFMGDCMLNEKYDFDWIAEGKRQLSSAEVFCVTPWWNYYVKAHDNSIVKEDNDYLFDRGFSDQGFLVKTAKWQQHIYSEYNVKSERYPVYGGNHFERRVFCYMNNRHYLRCVLKAVVYTHEKLVKPQFYQPPRFSIKDEVKHFIAKIKKLFRRRKILVKFLLR